MQYIFLEKTNEEGTEGAKKEKERRGENVEETLMISLTPVSSPRAKHSSKALCECTSSLMGWSES